VAPGPVKVNVAPLIVAAFMASLNVAETRVFTGTAVAPLAGTVEITEGGAAVVKVHTKFAASGAAVGSFAPVVIVAVNTVLLARTAVGVNVAVVPAYVTVPATRVAPGPVKVNVAPLIVAAFMASLNVAETRVFTGTAVAPLAGTVEITVGGAAAAAVVNVHTKFAASGTPAGSFAPVVMLAVNKVLLARTAVGVNVAALPA
jgi:hypothetical protein